MRRERGSDSAWSPARGERSLAMSFGALVLVLMAATALAASLLSDSLRRGEERKLAGAIAVILGESIGRVSFSGKYHARLFVEEIKDLLPYLSYVSVESSDGIVVAHSDPARNSSLIEGEDVDSLRLSLSSAGPVFVDRSRAGVPYREVLVTYRGGPGGDVEGVVRVGIDASRDLAARRYNFGLLLGMIAALAAGAIAAVAAMSRRFGGALKALNLELERKVLERTAELARANSELSRSNESLESAMGELTRTQSQLLRSEKLAVLGQLAASVAHELNTPLGAIESAASSIEGIFDDDIPRLTRLLSRLDEEGREVFLSLASIAMERATVVDGSRPKMDRRELERRLADMGVAEPAETGELLAELELADRVAELGPTLRRPDARELLEKAGSLANLRRLSAIESVGAEKAAAVVRALRSYLDKGEDDPLAVVDLASEIETVLTLYRGRTKGVEIARRYADGSTVRGNKDKLNQVWINLINNALDAMEGEGRIEISTAIEGSYVVVELRDDGPGVPAELRDKVFEPFFTTKTKGGLGLGLDICRRIVDSLGGGIELAEGGPGAAFVVRLPRAEAGA